eukprot:GEMP01054667.1.p1 GENE.GEMP01054667.1~~GEMP01054667.1.p1  ORF type:complete len:417 (+),score=100.75 GEMP01054667.1:46-1296(+)
MDSLHAQIQQFAQSSSSSWAFPATLSSDQRREAKTLAATFGLQAASFGAGGDRRLHLLRGSPNPDAEQVEGSVGDHRSIDGAAKSGDKKSTEKVVGVRNTFIHVEDADAREAIDRSIWTMPVGALHVELMRELGEVKTLAQDNERTNTKAADVVTVGHSEDTRLADSRGGWIGCAVVLSGLKNADYNGVKGIVDSFDDATQRFNVRLDGENDKDDIWRWVKVRPHNMVLDIEGAEISDPQPEYHGVDSGFELKTGTWEDDLTSYLFPSIAPPSLWTGGAQGNASVPQFADGASQQSGWSPSHTGRVSSAEAAASIESPDHGKFRISLDSLVAPPLDDLRSPIQLDCLLPGPSEPTPVARADGLSLGDFGIAVPNHPLSDSSSDSGQLLVFGNDIEDPIMAETCSTGLPETASSGIL